MECFDNNIYDEESKITLSSRAVWYCFRSYSTDGMLRTWKSNSIFFAASKREVKITITILDSCICIKDVREVRTSKINNLTCRECKCSVKSNTLENLHLCVGNGTKIKWSLSLNFAFVWKLNGEQKFPPRKESQCYVISFVFTEPPNCSAGLNGGNWQNIKRAVCMIVNELFFTETIACYHFEVGFCCNKKIALFFAYPC